MTAAGTVTGPASAPLAPSACREAALPIRVGFVMHTMQVAGAEVLVAEIIRRLGPRIRPTVLCIDQVGRLGHALRAEGVEVLAFERRGRDWALVGRLAHAVATRRIEVLHAHQYTPFFYAALARARLGLRPRLVLTEHGRHFPDRVSPLRRSINRALLQRLADVTTAVCDFSRRSLSRVDGFAGSAIRVLPNGIDVHRYGRVSDRRAVLERLGLAPERRHLVCVARFHPIKDHATLVRGFARAADALADLDLVLVGEGPGRGEIETLVGSLGIGARVHFLGVRSDVPEILGAADGFAMTSLCEAASLTVMEAMASGLPIIVTGVGGNPELVRDGHEGVLVPRQDPDATARAIVSVFRRPETARALGAAARRRALEHYRLEDAVRRYWEIYRQLAPRRKSSAHGDAS